MTAVTYAHPTISLFALVQIAGRRVCTTDEEKAT